MVGYPSDVEEVWLGADGVLSGAQPGALLIDMTTSSPELARRIAIAAAGRGCRRWTRRCPAATSGPATRNSRSWWAARQEAFDDAPARPATDGHEHRSPGRPGRRPAHQDVQPDRDRVHHHGRVRGTGLRQGGRAGPAHGAQVDRRRSGRRLPAQRDRRPRSSTATSRLASSSSTSSRTWASRWPKRSG